MYFWLCVRQRPGDLLATASETPCGDTAKAVGELSVTQDEPSLCPSWLSGKSRSGPCLAVASSEPDVTTGSGQDFSLNISVLKTQVHVSPLPKHHSSHHAHLHPPNLSAPGLLPLPCSRARLEFKLNEFSSTNTLNFQKQMSFVIQ